MESFDMEKLGSGIERGDAYFVFKMSHNRLLALLSKATDEESLIDIEITSTPLDEIFADIYRKTSSKTASVLPSS